MDTTALEAIEATDGWRNNLRQHGIAFVQSDDLAKRYRKQLKPVGQTIKEARENVIELLNSRNVSKCEIGELGVSLRVVKRQVKKAPSRGAIKERCATWFGDLEAEEAEAQGWKLYDHLFSPDVSEGCFLRRGNIAGQPSRAVSDEDDDVEDEGLE